MKNYTRKMLLAASLLALASSAAVAQERITFGATNAQSAHYAYFAALAKVVNTANPDIQVSVVETGATVDNLRRMARNQVDAGLITTSTLFHAYNGQQKFADSPVKSKLLFNYSLAPQNVIVRMDSGVNKISELTGKRFGPGMRGSSTEATTEAVYKLFDVKPNYVRGSNAELASAIKDNRSIGFVKSAVGVKFDALTLDIATFTPLKVLGLNDQQVELIRKNLPELSIIKMPGGQQENTGPYVTFGFMIGVGAKPDMSDEMAYKIVKAAMEDKQIQAAAFPQLKGQDLIQLTLDYATSPLHPGAIKYFEEVGYTVPESLR
jgi:TRAP transporter TAXI family solute receptor